MLKPLIAGLAVVAVLSVANPASATAVRKYAHQGHNQGYADINYNCSTAKTGSCVQRFSRIAVEDRVKDGHSTVIYFQKNDGSVSHLGDFDGSNNGYVVEDFYPGAKNYVTWIQVCTGEAPRYNQTCGTRIYTPGFTVRAA